MNETVDVSVVIATRGERPDALARCLEAVDHGAVRPREVIVVDQSGASGGGGGRSFPVHVITSGPGLSRGRNAGAAAAACELVAVTDDDCVPDAHWLQAAVDAFGSEAEIAAVCGAVLPLPDETGLLVPVSSRTSPQAMTATSSPAPWRLGSGGNIVISRMWLTRIGGWDERLGAGSPGLAGEDVDLLHRLLRAGGPIRYEPAAAVLHEQKLPGERRTRRRGYGFGVGAACALWLRTGDASGLLVLITWIALRLRLLASACARARWPAAADEVRVLRGTIAGARHGLRAR